MQSQTPQTPPQPQLQQPPSQPSLAPPAPSPPVIVSPANNVPPTPVQAQATTMVYPAIDSSAPPAPFLTKSSSSLFNRSNSLLGSGIGGKSALFSIIGGAGSLFFIVIIIFFSKLLTVGPSLSGVWLTTILLTSILLSAAGIVFGYINQKSEDTRSALGVVGLALSASMFVLMILLGSYYLKLHIEYKKMEDKYDRYSNNRYKDS